MRSKSSTRSMGDAGEVDEFKAAHDWQERASRQSPPPQQRAPVPLMPFVRPPPPPQSQQYHNTAAPRKASEPGPQWSSDTTPGSSMGIRLFGSRRTCQPRLWFYNRGVF